MISACKTGPSSIAETHQELANHILADTSLQTVERMARELLGKGFDAGGGYTQVWIRDLNTFIETSCEVYDPKEIRRHLLTFYYLQQKNGEIVDGFVPKGVSDRHDAGLYTSSADSHHEGFKNYGENRPGNLSDTGCGEIHPEDRRSDRFWMPSLTAKPSDTGWLCQSSISCRIVIHLDSA